MSQRKEKYARDLGIRMEAQENRVRRLETGMEDCLRQLARTCESPGQDRRVQLARRRAARAERAAVTWKAVAYGSLLAAIAVLIVAIAAVGPGAKAAAPDPEPAGSQPAVRTIPPPGRVYPAEEREAQTLPWANKIEDCTVTWYTADSCGKSPEHPAYGITASGLPAEEGVTCAVDPAVIPLYSTVWVARADGRLEALQATDTGVTGSWVDVYTEDREEAVRNGLQHLTVYWAAPEE